MKKAPVLAGILFLLPGVLGAQQAAPADTNAERLKTLEERVRALEAELQALKATCCAAAAPAPSAAAPPAAPAPQVAQVPVSVPGVGTAQLPVYGGASSAAKALNPDISVIGDFLGVVGHNSIRPVPALELHESEVGLQATPAATSSFLLANPA